MTSLHRNATVILIFLALCSCEGTDHASLKYRLKEYTHDEYRFVYNYDSLNRVSESETYYFNGLIYRTRYFYENDKLDSLIVFNSSLLFSYETFNYTDDTITAVTYRYSFNDSTIVKYAIINNRVFRVCSPHKYAELQWGNNNLLQKDIYNDDGWVWPDFKSAGVPSDYIRYIRVSCEYDSHLNPFHLLPEQLFFGEYESSANNLRSMIVSHMEGDTLIRKFKHTYSKNGLPAATIVTIRKNDTWKNEGIPLDTSRFTYDYEIYR